MGGRWYEIEIVDTETLEAIQVFADAYIEQRVDFPGDLQLFTRATPIIAFAAALVSADSLDPMDHHLLGEIRMGIRAYPFPLMQDRTLWVAVVYNHLKLAQLLIAIGARPHRGYDAAREMARNFGYSKMERLLEKAFMEQSQCMTGQGF